MQNINIYNIYVAQRVLVTRHMKVVRSSPLRTGRLYPQEYPGTHFYRPSPSPVTLPGIDPGTFRLLAQRLNHYAAPGSYIYIYVHKYAHLHTHTYIHIY